MDSGIGEISGENSHRVSFSPYPRYFLASAVSEAATSALAVDLRSLWQIVLFRSLPRYALR